MPEQEEKQEPVATARPIKSEEKEAITTAIRASHTLATLEVSLTTYDEIKDLLTNAGYDHALLDDGMIDMTGIGITTPKPDKVDIFINGKPYTIPYREGEMSYDEVRDLAFPDSEYPKFPSCTWSVSGTGKSGILYPGKRIMLEQGLIFNIVDTSNA